MDNVSTQLNKLYKIGLLLFRHFNAEMLHIMPLNGFKYILLDHFIRFFPR